jgi:hypothetical protein
MEVAPLWHLLGGVRILQCGVDVGVSELGYTLCVKVANS